jgi:LuxR family transcriptional regulator, quorum-sensing system regulator SolR
MPMRLLDMKSGALSNTGIFPHVLQPLVDAAARGVDLTPVVQAIIQGLGFDSFAYALTTSNRPDKEAQLFVFTTMPAEWMMLYDQRAYVEVDPRMQLIARSTMPILWEQKDFRGRSARVDEFLDDAARYGTLSGLVYALYDISHGGIVMVFNSKIPTVDPVRLQMIQRNLPDLLSFGHYFHEWFMKSVIERGLPSRLKNVPLSPREREVLRNVAHGLTTDDIASKLEISERTVQFHLDAVRTKLGAANRQEAVAIGMQLGLVSAFL